MNGYDNGYVRLLQIVFKLSKMQLKKKQMLSSSKSPPPTLKISNDRPVVRKSYQKHSRKGTKDYQAFNIHSLINFKYTLSAQQSLNRNYLYKINSNLQGYTSEFSLSIKQALTISNTKEVLNTYYILGKHRTQKNINQQSIQKSLVESIQNKNQLQFAPKAIMHFQPKIYTIMYQHVLRRKNYIKKVTFFQTFSSINREAKPWTKQLPTLVSDRDHESSYRQRSNKLNTSQSFELKKLTECIRDMFNKQLFKEKKEGMIAWGRGDSSWLLEVKQIENKPPIQCDFSSIQHHSKIDSRVKDNWCSETEETYGLGSLRQKYQEQKLKQKQSQIASKITIGHKRNPTQKLYTKQNLFQQPMTPKQNCKSVFTSAQNIINNSPKVISKKSKKKDVQVSQAYLLRFEHKKQPSIANFKQNTHRQKLKTQGSGRSSKSKQKSKLTFKKK